MWELTYLADDQKENKFMAKILCDTKSNNGDGIASLIYNIIRLRDKDSDIEIEISYN